MKLNKILGAAVVAGAVFALSSVSAFAAQAFTIGDPVDLSADATVKVEDIKAGMLLAFPVDMTSSTGSVMSFTFSADYDTDVLEPGIAKSSYSSVKSAIASRGAMVQDDNKTVVATIDAMLDEFDERAMAVSSSNYPGTQVIYTAAFSAVTSLNASKPEFYVLFTAKKDFPATDTLNKGLFVLNGEESNINIDDNISDYPDVDQPAANKCGAAFKLVLDSETMDYYVHSLTLKVNGVEKGKITEYVENGKKFEFPVRLIGTAPETVSITVEAETGTATEITGTKTLIDNQALTLNPTDYAEF